MVSTEIGKSMLTQQIGSVVQGKFDSSILEYFKTIIIRNFPKQLYFCDMFGYTLLYKLPNSNDL